MAHGLKVENLFLEDLKYENFDVTSACFPPFLDVLEDFQSVTRIAPALFGPRRTLKISIYVYNKYQCHSR